MSLATHMCNDHQPWCHFGCCAIEDCHHIFISCPRFAHLQQSALENLTSDISSVLQLSSIPPVNKDLITSIASALFVSMHPWPSCQSFYYLGITPKLNSDHFKCISIHVNQILHTAAIRLAGQIWGIVCCETHSHFYATSNTVQNNTNNNNLSILLPFHLSLILPPTPYQSFSVSFL